MKSLITALILICSSNLALAQQSVTITQKGNGNKVNINQGNAKTNRAKPKNGCNKLKNMNHNRRNRILVLRSDGRPDTLVSTSGKQRNRVSKNIGKQELSASQRGRGNGLSILLPDSQKAYKRFNSKQKGRRNWIMAALNDSIDNLTLSQKGSGNKIAINPCEEDKPGTHHHPGSSKIIQKGNGNSVSISQH